MYIEFVSIVVLLYPSYCLSQTSKEYFHSVGDTVILLCTLQRETYPMIWGFQFNTTFTYQYSTDNTINPNLEGISGRLSIVGNYDLQVSTIQRDDEGTYACRTNINGIIRQHLAILSIVIKPLKPTFGQTSLSTEETVPLTVSCTSVGSRPPASFQWYIGSTNVTTFAKDTSLYIQSTETYTVNSAVTYHVNRSYNTKEVTCKVTNIADHIGTQERRQLDVKYAPDITVDSHNYTQNDATRIVACYPNGNPDSYTYHGWQHKSKYGELIRDFVGNKTLILPDAPVLLRYQDNGEYICIASNGIKDKDDKFDQIGSGYVLVEANPVFTSDTFDSVKQFGEIGKAVEIYVNAISVPKFTSYIWECEGKPTTQNSAKYESSSSPTFVKDNIHGKEVQLDGYNVTLTIRDLKAEDFANYTVTLKSGFSDVRHTVILEAASVPETPGNFSKTATSTTTITVQWDPNSGGGYKQTFYIQYRVQGLLEWKILIVGEEDINEPKRRRTYELRKLREGRVYELKMFAENTAMRRSNLTDVLIVFTETTVSTTSSAVIGPVVGVVVTLVIVCASVLVILLFKSSQVKDRKEKNDNHYENNGFQDIQKGDKYEEVENKFDEKHKQSIKTYETLGTKDAIDVYDDIENPEGLTSSKSSLGHYEALGVHDKSSIYSDMNNKKTEQRQHRKQLAGKTQFKHSNNPKESIELHKTQGPTERVYANEMF